MRTFTAVKMESSDAGSSFRNMEDVELLACRVCLATDTKLCNLHEYQLAQSFGDLTGTPVLSTDGLPQHICNVCGMLLLKSSAFRTKCRQTHVFLQDARKQTPQITASYIRNIDRSNFQIPLITTNVLTVDFTPNEEKKDTDVDIIKEEIVESPVFYDDVPLNNDFGEDFSSTIFVTEIEAAQKMENDVTEDIKVENELMSNIEPYSFRNKRKNKDVGEDKRCVKKKKSPTKKLKKLKREIEAPPPIEIEEEEEMEKPPAKKKRMYNRKTEEDFESFSKMFNVEVVFLTREQQMAELQARKESDDYISARFQCEECYKCFMKESAYKKHMAWHDPSAGTHECDICRVRFPVRHKLMKHLRRHRMHFVCKFCNQISKDSTMAKLHFKWHEGFKYECQHCGRNFNKPSSYMNHVRENHSALTCDICEQAVSGTRGLTAHKAMAHSGMFKCISCEAMFSSEGALHRHVEITAAHGCDPCMRPCGQCGESFLADQLLNEHLEREHKDKIFRCEQCNTTYSSDRQLGIHWSRAHKGQRRRAGADGGDGDFMCEVCAKSYPNETTLRYHQRVHTGERPFPCPMCPKRFRMKTNLQVHINTHTGARPYKCTLCPETFKSYSQKHKHRLLVHTKERRHKCHMCEKTYVVSFDLKMHIRTVHMKIPLPPRNRRRRNNRVVEQ